MAKVKIKFLQAVDVTDGDGETVFAAKEGETVSLDESSANHWLIRGKAEIVTGRKKPEGKPADTGTGGDNSADA